MKLKPLDAVFAIATLLLISVLILSDCSIDARDSVGIKFASFASERNQGFFHGQAASAIWDVYGVSIFDREIVMVYTRESKVHGVAYAVLRSVMGIR